MSVPLKPTAHTDFGLLPLNLRLSGQSDGTQCVIATRSDPARVPRLAGRAPVGRPAAARPSATRPAPTRASRPGRAHPATPQSSGSAAPTRGGGRTRPAVPPPVRRVPPSEGESDLGLVLAERDVHDLTDTELHPIAHQHLAAARQPREHRSDIVDRDHASILACRRDRAESAPNSKPLNPICFVLSR